MRDSSKRIVSALIFAAGLSFSFVGCAASARGFFTLGANDSVGEVVAILICFPGFFAASILAFWKRRVAGTVMLALPLIFIAGMLDERRYILNVRHFPQESLFTDLWHTILPCLPVIFLGVFAFLTGVAGWQEVISRRAAPREDGGD